MGVREMIFGTVNNLNFPVAVGNGKDTVICNGRLWLKYRDIGELIMDLTCDCEHEWMEIDDVLRENLHLIVDKVLKTRGKDYSEEIV
jgi:hypothetical protein